VNTTSESASFVLKVKKGTISNDFEALDHILPKKKMSEQEQSLVKDDVDSEYAYVPNAYYPQLEKENEVQPEVCRASRFKVDHSVYKLARVAKVIRGMHIYDA